MLSKPKKRKSYAPRVHVGCVFCGQRIPPPKQVEAYSFEGALGGRCACGAFFVVDATGKHGGEVLLDLTTLACEGDSDRALELASGRDYELASKPLTERQPSSARARRPIGGRPQVYFLKLRDPP